MNRIGQLREEKGLTQCALADAIGVNQSTVNRYETGKYKPGLEVALRLIAVLDCTMSDILGQKMSDKGGGLYDNVDPERSRCLPADQ